MGRGGKGFCGMHDVEVNYFTCGFICHFFYLCLSCTLTFSRVTQVNYFHKSKITCTTTSKVIYFNVVYPFLSLSCEGTKRCRCWECKERGGEMTK